MLFNMIKIVLTDQTIQIAGPDMELGQIEKFETYDDAKLCFSKGGYDPRKLKHVPLMKTIRGVLVGYAGLAKEIMLFCKKSNIAVESFEDKRTHFDFQKKEYTYEELRKYFNPEFKYVDHQIKALQTMLSHNKAIIAAPTSAGKCCSGETKIIANKKPIKIKKLFRSFAEEMIAVPDKDIFVLTENGDQKVEALYKTNKREVLTLKLKNGYKITAVPEHRVLTNNGWKQLKDLKKGELVLCETKRKNYWKEKNMWQKISLIYRLKRFVILLAKKIYSKLDE